MDNVFDGHGTSERKNVRSDVDLCYLPETEFSSLTSKSDIAGSSRCLHDTPIRFPFFERVAPPWYACVYHVVRHAHRARDRDRAHVLFSGLVEFGLDFRGFSVCRIFLRVGNLSETNRSSSMNTS
jgi:hypothetical protein